MSDSISGTFVYIQKKIPILSDRICDVSRFLFSLSETLCDRTHTHTHIYTDMMMICFISFCFALATHKHTYILMHLSFPMMFSVFTFIHICRVSFRISIANTLSSSCMNCGAPKYHVYCTCTMKSFFLLNFYCRAHNFLLIFSSFKPSSSTLLLYSFSLPLYPISSSLHTVAQQFPIES